MGDEVDRLLRASRVIRRADAVLAGMSDAALRAARRDGRIVRQLRGVDLTAAAQRTHDGRFHALQAIAPHAALSGPSAARWHRWEVPAAWPDELTVAPGSRRPRQRRRLRIVTRQLERGVTERYGLRATDPARTIAELLRGSDVVAQLRLLDQALRSGVSREAVIGLLPARGPGSGARARQLLALGDARSESPLESAVALALTRGGLPTPERQLVVHDADGRFLARVDFAWPRHRVLLEADGLAHHTAPAALAHDRDRQNRLVNAGWRPLRTTWSQAVHAPESLAAVVRAALAPCT